MTKASLLLCYCPRGLTFLLHLNQWWNWSWLAYSHLVVGAHPETVLLVSLQCRHYVWGTGTLIGQLPPVCRISSSRVLYLHHVAQDGAATIVTGPRPGQLEAGGWEAGDHGTGGRRLWCFCWDYGGAGVQRSAALLQMILRTETCTCLTYDRQSECVLCWAPAVSHHYRVATCVLRRRLGDHQRAAQICGFYPQLWTIHNLKSIIEEEEASSVVRK